MTADRLPTVQCPAHVTSLRSAATALTGNWICVDVASRCSLATWWHRESSCAEYKTVWSSDFRRDVKSFVHAGWLWCRAARHCTAPQRNARHEHSQLIQCVWFYCDTAETHRDASRLNDFCGVMWHTAAVCVGKNVLKSPRYRSLSGNRGQGIERCCHNFHLKFTGCCFCACSVKRQLKTDCSVSGNTLQYRLEESVSHRRTRQVTQLFTYLLTHKLFSSCTRRYRVSRGGDWVMPALSAV